MWVSVIDFTCKIFIFRNVYRCKSTIFRSPYYSLWHIKIFNGSSRNLTASHTTCDAFMNWLLAFSRDVSLGRLWLFYSSRNVSSGCVCIESERKLWKVHLDSLLNFHPPWQRKYPQEGSLAQTRHKRGKILSPFILLLLGLLNSN